MSSKLQKIASYPAYLRIIIFFLFLVINWLPFPIVFFFTIKNNQNLLTILTMGSLFIEFLALTIVWGKLVYQKSNLFAEYGLVFTRKNGLELLNYLLLGLFLNLALFWLQKTFNLISFQQPSLPLYRLVLEGLLSGLGVALAEELVFRGWFLTELEQDYSLSNSLLINSFFFALLHFLKPIPEIIRTFPAFPGLFLLAINLVSLKRNHQNRLGSCIGLHGGLVWGYYIFNVGEIIQYHDHISPWLTGVDKNPIAGIIGLAFLTILTLINTMNRQ